MTTAQALQAFFVHKKVMDPDTPREDWYKDNWVRVPFRGRKIPVLPIHGFKKSFILHDIHHVLTGYDINFKGELEIAAWELASGGCGRYYLYWIDRIIFTLLGLIFYPKATCRAYETGQKHKNIFSWNIDKALDEPLDALQATTVPEGPFAQSAD